MRLPDTFVLNKFYQYSYEPSFRKHDGTYNAGCPVCKEGKSLGKKKRLFFYPESNTFHCFNCSRSWSAYKWIVEVCRMTKEEIDHEVYTNDFSVDVVQKLERMPTGKKELPDLPYDSINLYDELQVKFHINNKNFNDAYEYAKSRRLFTAINRSPNLFVSLTDMIHKNRLCIPFYDTNKKLPFYQTRCVDGSEPRYLGKRGYDKTLFGIDRIITEIPYIFIFEGPIDAMFVKNGISSAGLSLSELQNQQLSEFPFHKKIWVLDNPNVDNASLLKMTQFMQTSQKVFKWKPNMPYKDFNDMAITEKLDEIDYQILID